MTKSEIHAELDSILARPVFGLGAEKRALFLLEALGVSRFQSSRQTEVAAQTQTKPRRKAA